MNIQNFQANPDALLNVFNLLTFKDISFAARVCVRWKDLTNCCQKKKDSFKELLERRIVSIVSNPNLKECYFITSMLDEQQATPRLVSKFIRGEADEECILKAVSIAKSLTSEQMTDALDTKRTLKVVQSLLDKMKEAPESAIIACIRQGNVEMLPIFLEKSSMSPQVLLNKAIDFEKYQCVKMILSFYSEMAVSIGDVIETTKNINLLPEDFYFLLDRYLQQEDNKISFGDFQKISSIIDERLSLARAPHNEKTEKVFELAAKAYVKTNQIHSLELLIDNFDVELFIRNGKHSVMAAKLIQAVEEYSLLNRKNVAVLFNLANQDQCSPIAMLPQEINRKIVENLLF